MYVCVSMYVCMYYVCMYVCIRECRSTLFVGLMGIVRTLIQKSRDGHVPFKHLSFFLKMSKASDNTKAAMKKQIRQIHSVFSHVGP